VIEQKSFRVQEHAELDDIADLLDKAFAEGWQYTAQLPVGRGLLVVLSRVLVPPAPPEKKPTKQLQEATH
jgi:hypothetical protein